MIDWHKFYKYEDGLLMNHRGHIYHNLDRDGYIRVRLNNREYRAHRIIWEMHNGEIPEGMLIDHIDGDVSNNYLDNLRIATRTQNNANALGKGGIAKGVVPVGDKYRARITRLGKTMSLGTFDTIEEASAAYINKAAEFDGEFLKV